jgi:dienelactone hydrolase
MRRALLSVIRKRPRVAATFVLAQMLPFGLGWLKRLERVEVRGVEDIDADLYVPRTGGRFPGLVLLLGALLEGREYGPLRELAAAIARAGYAVLVPELGRLRQLALGEDAVRDALEAVEVLRRQPEVSSAAVGIYGFSAGATIGLLAAAADERPPIAFVAGLGGYIWIDDLIAQVTTGARLERTSVYAVVNSMIELLPPGDDTDLLQAALRSARGDVLAAFSILPADGMAPAAAAVLAVIQNREPGAVPALLERLPPEQRQALEVLSPGIHLDRVRAPVWLLHDRNDPYIPVEHALRVRSDPRAAEFRVLITSALEHVELRGAALSPLGRAWVYLRNLPALVAFAAEPLAVLRDDRGSGPVPEQAPGAKRDGDDPGGEVRDPGAGEQQEGSPTPGRDASDHVESHEEGDEEHGH